MTVLTAHKILISSAIVMFLLYAVFELHNYVNDDPSALLRSILSATTALGLAVYLRWVWVHRPGDSTTPAAHG